MEKTLSKAERAALNAYVGRLRSCFDGRLREVCVFGSRARGDQDEASDIDVLVVLDAVSDEDHDAVHAITADAKRYEGAYVALAPLVLDETRELLAGRRRLFREIEREGIVL